jgi:hypothetical protein
VKGDSPFGGPPPGGGPPGGAPFGGAPKLGQILPPFLQAFMNFTAVSPFVCAGGNGMSCTCSPSSSTVVGLSNSTIGNAAGGATAGTCPFGPGRGFKSCSRRLGRPRIVTPSFAKPAPVVRVESVHEEPCAG